MDRAEQSVFERLTETRLSRPVRPVDEGVRVYKFERVLVGKPTKVLDLHLGKPDDLILVGVRFVGRDFECQRRCFPLVDDQFRQDFPTPASGRPDRRDFVESPHHQVGQLFLVFGQSQGRLDQEAF